MRRSWVDFPTTGDPGWPEYRPDRQVLRIDAESSVGPDESAPYAQA
jgi:para-nitrobenzyl esterase